MPAFNFKSFPLLKLSTPTFILGIRKLGSTELLSVTVFSTLELIQWLNY
ncbi:hypothetical protein [Lactococcus lactis]|nr:hypothetical protein [Lactococcus lactis]